MTTEFFFEVADEGSAWLTQHMEALPEGIENLSHWTLSIEEYDNHSHRLIHIYYHGKSPSDEVRDRVNDNVKWFCSLRFD